MSDEILEKMRATNGATRTHDMEGVVALGQWIVCERTAVRSTTGGGLVVPEASAMPIWTVVSVGPEVETVLGRRIAVGQRLFFTNPTATFVLDGRGFALCRANEAIAVLRMPDPDEAPRIIVAKEAVLQ